MNIHSFELESFMLRDSINSGDVESALIHLNKIMSSELSDEVKKAYHSQLDDYSSIYPELLKIRADRFKENREYLSALNTYTSLLNYIQDSSLYSDIAFCFGRLNKFDVALAYCLRSNPNAKFYHVYSDICYRQGNYDKAIESIKMSIDMDPKVDKTFTLATYLIANKDPLGWKLLKSRFYKETNPTESMIKTDKPLWSKDKPKGRILVCSEQGHGDVIQFSRFIPELLRYASEVYFYTRPELARLFSNSFDNIRVVTNIENVDFDYYINLLDLIGELDIPLSEFRRSSYLKSDIFSLPSSKKKIGIAWQGAASGDPQRNMSLSDFESLIKDDSVQLYSFQKGLGLSSCASLFSDLGIIDLGSSFNSFYDTACSMQSLDLFITTDNCLVHLAGALGIPTYLILSEVPEYRWMNETDSTIWYDSVSVIRKDRSGWKSCVDEIRKFNSLS